MTENTDCSWPMVRPETKEEKKARKLAGVQQRNTLRHQIVGLYEQIAKCDKIPDRIRNGDSVMARKYKDALAERYDLMDHEKNYARAGSLVLQNKVTELTNILAAIA